eukprot:GGOE01008647.1.p1 GENE.GGOE01008647.1~~GGOE01008647.1.p1  ORF type:complete len:286 (-),score=104.16 GGOE01008647.1:1655-2488(-)
MAPCQPRMETTFALNHDADMLLDVVVSHKLRRESDSLSEVSTIPETLLGQLQTCCSEVLDVNTLQALSTDSDRRVRQLLIAMWQLHEDNAGLQEEVRSLREQLQEARAQAQQERRKVAEELSARDDQQWQAIQRLRELLQHLHTMLFMTVDLLPLDPEANAQFSGVLSGYWEQATPLTVARLGVWDTPLCQFQPLLDSCAQLIDVGLQMVGKGYDAQCRAVAEHRERPAEAGVATATPLMMAGWGMANGVWWAAAWLMGLWWALLFAPRLSGRAKQA